MWQDHYATLGWTAAVIAITLIARFLYRLYFVRSLFRKYNIPGPPHHPLWGHIHLTAKVFTTQPKRIAPQSIFAVLQHQLDLPDLFMLDFWPLGPPSIVVTDPDIMSQFTVKRSLPKHPELPVVADFTDPIAGRDNMVVSEGQQWKTWRGAFNPGFSASHLMTLMSGIVDDVSVFRDILEQRARTNELFRMEHLATRLTIDIIGNVILDTRFNSQRSENELVSAFESLVRWIPIGGLGNPSELINPIRPLILRWNTWRMNRYVSRELEARFASRKSRGKTKHVIDLALETYLREKGDSTNDVTTLDKTFKREAINNVKIFLFAGHDTSSSAICYCFYHLSRNPEALAAMRRECDDLFGTDVTKTAELIKDSPILLNKMEYGLAVIREVLRLQPPASTVRIGAKDFFIVDPKTGQRYPTEHLMLFPVNVGIHRNPRLWNDPHVFRPQRWLTKAAPPEGANREAFVGFSKGPRNCIGQELAILEIKTVLAMTVREFDFTAAFDELDKLRGDGSGYPSDMSGIQEQFGDEAYQIQLGTAKPREGMPCRMRPAQRTPK
ncbi:hypothetical protein MBLNU459_g4865t1 [Dothideomycetes sp. NU459]